MGAFQGRNKEKGYPVYNVAREFTMLWVVSFWQKRYSKNLF